MIRSLFTGTTGMNAQQLNIDVIANNLANVSTTGFKKSITDFQDLLYETIKVPGSQTSTDTQSPTGILVGNGFSGGNPRRGIAAMVKAAEAAEKTGAIRPAW